MTSHDVVAVCRRHFGERRVGHAGTLDPDATGVLLVGVGSVTRLLRFLSAADKSYVGEVVFGVETTTLDASGTVMVRHHMHVAPDDVANAVAAHLVGDIQQVPPMVSALKVGGRRLHALAREGVEVERPPRPVTVRRFEVEPTADPLVYRLAVTCSSGTYVRSLVADLGHLLGGGAHLRNLRRIAVGGFDEVEARPLDAPVLLAPRAAVRDLPTIAVDADAARRVAHGGVLPRPEGAGPWAVVDGDGALLAVYEVTDGDAIKPAVVLSAG